MKVQLTMVFLAASVTVLAQEHNVTIERRSGSAGEAGSIGYRVNTGEMEAKMKAGTFEFIQMSGAFEGKTVKGVPFSAQTINETSQMLADGNRISHKTTGALYRDSEGRIRREQALSTLGPWSTSGQTIQNVTISDPANGSAYSFNDQSKTARKVTTRSTFHVSSSSGGVGVSMPPEAVEKIKSELAARKASAAVTPGDLVQELLGRQTIEGVVCDGTRTTITIPAGAIGNEFAIKTVSELWYSPELQTVVMTKNSDPRVGDSTYRLVGISRSEPAHSLFEIPADYALTPEHEMALPKVERVHAPE
jgi:hypothetical protein